MRVTICTANCVGQAGNCSYPNRVTVVTPEQLQEAVKKDHVCAEFKGNYRSVENFIRSDVIVMDIDNDHTGEPTEWITPEKLEELFPNVEYLLAPSRHHLLDKEGKSARPRYHMYFPISEITDAGRYANLKKAIQSVYSFFDGNALDAARFIFGAECDEVIYHDGWVTVDEEVDVSDVEEEDFNSEMSGGKSTGPILEGSRNNTMSRFAGRILKKYGDTEKAHEAFWEHARKCDPPLPDSELKSIWNSAVKFYRKSIVTQHEASLYDDMEAEMFLPLRTGEITAANAAALSGKLLQMANGAVYSDDGDEIQIHDQKLDALEDLIEAANGKPVMVAYWFKHDLTRIRRRLSERKISFEKLDSEESIRKWNRGELPVALIHPASAGHGLNLQSGGNILIWFGLTWSLELYQQTVARLWRQGQSAETVVVQHIITAGTIDEDVMKALADKDMTQNRLIAAVKARVIYDR